MLATLGFLMVGCFMTLIMTRRISAMTALLLVPIAFAIVAGHGTDLGKMISDGMLKVAPIGITLMFAILYFGIMIDVGLFDPLVRLVVRGIGIDPVRIAIGTALLSLVVSLDGDAMSTAIIVIGALYPVYRSIGMSPLVLLTLLGISNSIMNLTPWGGPVARVAASLHVDPNDIFLPLIPAMLVASSFVVLLAWRLGSQERKRLGPIAPSNEAAAASHVSDIGNRAKSRGMRYAANVLLTIAVMGLGVTRKIPLPVAFMLGSALALLLNFRGIKAQHERIAAHSENAFVIIALILCAGSFTGILTGTGMVSAMGDALVRAIPSSVGPYFAMVTAVLAMPLTFLMSNDAYYFGIVPVLAKTAAAYGVSSVEIARAAILAGPVHALSPLVPAVYLVTSMLNVEIGDVQRVALKWAVITTFVLLGAAIITGAIKVPL